MISSIDRIQQNNIYKVNPVNLFERRKDEQNNIFNNNLFSSTGKEFNLNHPQTTQTGNLDFLA